MPVAGMMQSPMTAAAAKCRLTRYIMLLLSRGGQCVCRPIRHRKVPARAATVHVRNPMLRCDVGGDPSRYCCNVDWVTADAALDQILDRLPHACAADFEPLDQAVFRQQLGLWRQAADSDMTPSSVSSASGKWTPHEPLIILLLANRPFLIAS